MSCLTLQVHQCVCIWQNQVIIFTFVQFGIIDTAHVLPKILVPIETAGFVGIATSGSHSRSTTALSSFVVKMDRPCTCIPKARTNSLCTGNCYLPKSKIRFSLAPIRSFFFTVMLLQAKVQLWQRRLANGPRFPADMSC